MHGETVKNENLLAVNFNVIFKLEICYIEMTNLLQVTINIRQIPSSTSLQLVCGDGVFFVWVDLHVPLCVKKCERVLVIVYPPFSCKIRYSSNPQNKNLTDLKQPDSNSFNCVTIQTDTPVGMNFTCHNDQYFRLLKYWHFLAESPCMKPKLYRLFKSFRRLKVMTFSAMIGHIRNEQNQFPFRRQFPLASSRIMYNLQIQIIWPAFDIRHIHDDGDRWSPTGPTSNPDWRGRSSEKFLLNLKIKSFMLLVWMKILTLYYFIIGKLDTQVSIRALSGISDML